MEVSIYVRFILLHQDQVGGTQPSPANTSHMINMCIGSSQVAAQDYKKDLDTLITVFCSNNSYVSTVLFIKN